jgi:hypothetical protein
MIVLSYADSTDATASNLLLVVISAGLILVAGGMALVPAAIARKRRHRQAEAVLGMAVLWALLAAGLVIYSSMAEMQWAKEQTLRIESGYADAGDNSGAPVFPWPLAGALAVAYAGLVFWARNGSPANPRRVATPNAGHAPSKTDDAAPRNGQEN